jgi:hypothetical protein
MNSFIAASRMELRAEGRGNVFPSLVHFGSGTSDFGAS